MFQKEPNSEESNPDRAIPVSSNPYAPPAALEATTTDPSESVSDALESLGTVAFSGSVNSADLDEYLRTDGHVGVARIVLLALGLGTLLSALPMLGLSYFAISLGAMGIVAIVLLVSTLPYRRLVFTNTNQNWSDPIEGHFRKDGVHLRRDDNKWYYHWNWFCEAIVADNLIAMLPATQTAAPLILTREMFATEEDWETLRHVAHAIGRLSNDADLEDVHREQNLQILRDQHRDWTVQPPSGTIAFEGIVWNDDYDRLPRRFRIRQRPMRTQFVIYGLILFSGLILGGCSGVIFHQIALLPVIVAVYFFATLAIAKRRPKRTRSVIYYLRGYAGENSLVTDFGVSVGETLWSGMELVSARPDYLVLRRTSLSNFVVIRSDMVPDESQWAALLTHVHDRVKAVEQSS